jgi:hypothetical protein
MASMKPPDTVKLYNAGLPTAYVEVDSEDTLQRLVKSMNEYAKHTLEVIVRRSAV